MDYSFIGEIPSCMFSKIQEIGSGTFSDVYSAIHTNTNSRVALKISLKSHEKTNKAYEQEILINKSLDHPFICKYFSHFETDHLKIIVMEYVEGISVLNHVNKTHRLPYQEALDIFTQLIIAIQYLHDEVHIAHRDLKLENIMIDKFNHIRLIDFGFSTDKSMLSTFCGSLPYIAPEILSGQKYTKAADIWSLGVILYALIDGNLPFCHSNMNKLALMICRNEVKFSSNFRDDEVKNLIQRMLIKDPNQRITIDEILRHPALSRQSLLSINYKELFQSKNSMFVTSQKLDDNQPILAKSLTTIQLNSYQMLRNHSINDNFNHLDDIIKNRNDFAFKLNKLIESALLYFPQKNVPLHFAFSTNLGSHLGGIRFKNNNQKINRQIFKKTALIVQPNAVKCNTN